MFRDLSFKRSDFTTFLFVEHSLITEIINHKVKQKNNVGRQIQEVFLHVLSFESYHCIIGREEKGKYNLQLGLHTVWQHIKVNNLCKYIL